MLDQVVPKLLEGEFICEATAPSLFRALADEAFRSEHREDFRRLEEALARKAEVEAELSLGTPEQKAEFLQWFDRWFLRRAQPAEEAAS